MLTVLCNNNSYYIYLRAGQDKEGKYLMVRDGQEVAARTRRPAHPRPPHYYYYYHHHYSLVLLLLLLLSLCYVLLLLWLLSIIIIQIIMLIIIIIIIIIIISMNIVINVVINFIVIIIIITIIVTSITIIIIIIIIIYAIPSFLFAVWQVGCGLHLVCPPPTPHPHLRFAISTHATQIKGTHFFCAGVLLIYYCCFRPLTTQEPSRFGTEEMSTEEMSALHEASCLTVQT